MGILEDGDRQNLERELLGERERHSLLAENYSLKYGDDYREHTIGSSRGSLEFTEVEHAANSMRQSQQRINNLESEIKKEKEYSRIKRYLARNHIGVKELTKMFPDLVELGQDEDYDDYL